METKRSRLPIVKTEMNVIETKRQKSLVPTARTPLPLPQAQMKNEVQKAIEKFNERYPYRPNEYNIVSKKMEHNHLELINNKIKKLMPLQTSQPSTKNRMIAYNVKDEKGLVYLNVIRKPQQGTQRDLSVNDRRPKRDLSYQPNMQRTQYYVCSVPMYNACQQTQQVCVAYPVNQTQNVAYTNQPFVLHPNTHHHHQHHQQHQQHHQQHSKHAHMHNIEKIKTSNQAPKNNMSVQCNNPNCQHHHNNYVATTNRHLVPVPTNEQQQAAKGHEYRERQRKPGNGKRTHHSFPVNPNKISIAQNFIIPELAARQQQTTQATIKTPGKAVAKTPTSENNGVDKEGEQKKDKPLEVTEDFDPYADQRPNLQCAPS